MGGPSVEHHHWVKDYGPSLMDIKKDLTGDLNIALIGGGLYGCQVLELLLACDSICPGIRVLGVTDPDPASPLLPLARQYKIFVAGQINELLSLRGFNVLLDLSGDRAAAGKILGMMPPGCSYFDLRATGILLELVREKKRSTEIEKNRNMTQRILNKQQVIIDSIPYRIMVVNEDLTIDTVNKTYLDWFGTTWQEIKGRKCYEIRYGFEKPCQEMGWRCYLEETKEHKKVFSTIIDFEEEEGTRYEVVTTAPILNEQGELVQFVEASRDVTERIKLEREVQNSNIFLQNVLQSTVHGIVVIDTKGKVLLFNEGMERLTGHRAQDIKNEGHLSIFYNMELARENMKKMRSDQYGPLGKLNPTRMTIKNVHGEEIPVTLSASIVEINGQEVGSVGIFTDMREIDGMRKELDEAHLQLVQSEKIASVGRMAAGVAHEINNPLSIIMIYAELLEQAFINQPETLNDAREIIGQTQRCKEIVSDLLEFSRKSIGQAAPFSLTGLIERCLNLQARLAAFHNISVHREIERGLPDMIGDEGQLEQVFTNLFANAADAMEGRGRLKVQAGYFPDRDVFTVKVFDTGPGIPEKHRGQIFDIFFTTKRVGQGTGLGLSITKNIIELHGGSIRFECPSTGGTIFIIDLPREAMAPLEEEPIFLEESDR